MNTTKAQHISPKINTQFITDNCFTCTSIPTDIVIVKYSFDLSVYNINLFIHFDIYCPNVIKNSVIKRQTEYLAGRYAAKQALKRFGITKFQIKTGRHRNPLWPEKISASISHTRDIVLCVSAMKKDYQYIGIDIEELLSKEIVMDIKSTIININEDNLLKNSINDYYCAFTVIFSAKESLFKALYPSVGDYFDFLAAELVSICFSNKKIEIKLLKTLSSKLVVGKVFTIYFSVDEYHVQTIIYHK